MKRHEGPDFYVCYFSDASTKSQMGLYVGHNPSLGSDEAGDVDVQRDSGEVGHVTVEWLRWSKDGRHRSETLVRGFFGQGAPRAFAELALHIFIGAPSEQEVGRMEAATATLRLAESPKTVPRRVDPRLLEETGKRASKADEEAGMAYHKTTKDAARFPAFLRSSSLVHGGYSVRFGSRSNSVERVRHFFDEDGKWMRTERRFPPY